MSDLPADAGIETSLVDRLQHAAKAADEAGDAARAERMMKAADDLRRLESQGDADAGRLTEEEFLRQARRAMRPRGD